MVNKILYRKSVKTEDKKEILLTLGVAVENDKYPKKAVIIISSRDSEKEISSNFIMLDKDSFNDFIDNAKEIFS